MNDTVTNLAKALLEDLSEFDKCYHEAIIYVYLHKAYIQGDHEAWTKALDDGYNDSECELEDPFEPTLQFYATFKDNEAELEEPFDSDFFGGEK